MLIQAKYRKKRIIADGAYIFDLKKDGIGKASLTMSVAELKFSQNSPWECTYNFLQCDNEFEGALLKDKCKAMLLLSTEFDVYIKNNLCVTVNNVLGVMSEAICQ